MVLLASSSEEVLFYKFLSITMGMWLLFSVAFISTILVVMSKWRKQFQTLSTQVITEFHNGAMAIQGLTGEIKGLAQKTEGWKENQEDRLLHVEKGVNSAYQHHQTQSKRHYDLLTRVEKNEIALYQLDKNFSRFSSEAGNYYERVTRDPIEFVEKKI